MTFDEIESPINTLGLENELTNLQPTTESVNRNTIFETFKSKAEHILWELSSLTSPAHEPYVDIENLNQTIHEKTTSLNSFQLSSLITLMDKRAWKYPEFTLEHLSLVIDAIEKAKQEDVKDMLDTLDLFWNRFCFTDLESSISLNENIEIVLEYFMEFKGNEEFGPFELGNIFNYCEVHKICSAIDADLKKETIKNLGESNISELKKFLKNNSQCDKLSLSFLLKSLEYKDKLPPNDPETVNRDTILETVKSKARDILLESFSPTLSDGEQYVHIENLNQTIHERTTSLNSFQLSSLIRLMNKRNRKYPEFTLEDLYLVIDAIKKAKQEDAEDMVDTLDLFWNKFCIPYCEFPIDFNENIEIVLEYFMEFKGNETLDPVELGNIFNYCEVHKICSAINPEVKKETIKNLDKFNISKLKKFLKEDRNRNCNKLSLSFLLEFLEYKDKLAASEYFILNLSKINLGDLEILALEQTNKGKNRVFTEILPENQEVSSLSRDAALFNICKALCSPFPVSAKEIFDYYINKKKINDLIHNPEILYLTFEEAQEKIPENQEKIKNIQKQILSLALIKNKFENYNFLFIPRIPAKENTRQELIEEIEKNPISFKDIRAALVKYCEKLKESHSKNRLNELYNCIQTMINPAIKIDEENLSSFISKVTLDDINPPPDLNPTLPAEAGISI